MSIIIANETIGVHKSPMGMVISMAIAAKALTQHNPNANF
jgi:hypothetical protein